MMSQNGVSITWYPNLYAIKTTLNVWCHKMMTVLLDIPACMPLKPPQMYDVTKWWQYRLPNIPACMPVMAQNGDSINISNLKK